MASPHELIRQQRLLWGAALIVALILIVYEDAPVIPVVMGCVLVAAIAVIRSWLRAKNNHDRR